MPDLTPGTPSAVAQAPQTKVGRDAFMLAPANVPQTSIAQGLDAIGSGLSDLAVPIAQAGAAQDVAKQHDPNRAVTLNPDGTPQVITPSNSFILGRAGEAYDAAVMAGTRNDLQSTITQNIANFRVANPTNVQGFTAAASTYAESLRSTYGGALGNQLADQVHNEASQHAANMMEANARRDTAVSLQSITTGIENTKNQMAALARQGAINTAQYDQLQDKLQDGYDQLGSNPLFGFGQDKVQSELSRTLDDLKGQYVVGQVDQAFHRTSGDGGRAGAQKVLEDQILNNPDLRISDDERKQLYSWGMSRLSYLTDTQKAQIAASKQTSESVMTALAKNPSSVPDALFDQAVSKARDVGDADSVGKLNAARAVSTMMRPMAGGTPEQQFNSMVGNSYFANLVQQENPTGNPLAGNGGGATQITNGTWQAIMARHPELNLTPDGRTDPAQNQRATIALTNDNRSALTAAGIPANDKNTYMAHFLGAQGATSFINAMQANPNAPAAASNLAAATANPNVFYKGGDPNQPRTLQEVYDLQTRRFGGGTTPTASANGIPFTPEQMTANPFLLSAVAHSVATNAANTEMLGKQIGSGLEMQIKAGLTPDPTTLANFFQVASQHPETFGEQSQRIQAGIVANAGVSNAASPADAQAFVDQTKAAAAATPSIFNAQVAEAAQQSFTRQTEALKTDPFPEAARRGWLTRPPAPLDFSSGDALTHSMVERASAATMIGAHTGVAGTSAISPAEMPALKSVMQSGPVDQRLALLGAITGANMSQPVMKATLSQLAGEKETLPLAVAGSLTRSNPDAARAILTGQALLQAEPKLAPKTEEFPTELSKALSFNDFPQTTAREGIQTAVKAYYAKLSADANDTTGVLNDDRMKASIDAVTGGVTSYRGSSFIAPWYGAGQEGLDGALRSLNDADFAGAKTTDGQPFPAAALKPSLMGSLTWNNWRLQSQGDGKYYVFSGADDKRQYLSDGAGGKFVLDLGAKRADAARLSAGPMYDGGARSNLYNSALMGGGN